MLQLKMMMKSLKSDGGYTTYIVFSVVEICLVVVGILLALQFDNWDREQDYRQFERQYYQDMQTQLNEDKAVLLSEIKYSKYFQKQYKQGVEIIANNDISKQKELAKITLNLKNYSDFRRKSSIYQTLVSSGEIKHIRHKGIVHILQNLEGEYELINRLENTHMQIIMETVSQFIIKGIRISSLSVEDSELLYSYPFQNTIVLTVGLIDEKVEMYEKSIAKIDKLQVLIEAELMK